MRSVTPDITASEVHRVSLWILGQYSESDEEVTAALHTIRQCIGPLPLTTPFADCACCCSPTPPPPPPPPPPPSPFAPPASIFTHFSPSPLFPTDAAGVAAEAAAAVSASGPIDSKAASRPVVLADGTYASQSGLEAPVRGRTVADIDDTPVPSLRKLLLAGDFYLGSVISSTLTKLALRVTESHSRESRTGKATLVDAMLVMCSIIELGGSGLAGSPILLPAHLMPPVAGRTYGSTRPGPPPPAVAASAGGGAATPGGTALPSAGLSGALGAPAPAAVATLSGVRIDQDSFERIVLCMRVLGDPASAATTLPVLLRSCREKFRSLLTERRGRAAQAIKDGISGPTGSGVSFAAGIGSNALYMSSQEEESKRDKVRHVRADEAINIRQLRGAKAGSAVEDLDLDDGADVDKATGTIVEDFASRLKRVHQLTGFADPVYCEAYVSVHEFDIVLEMLVINRTDTTLTNVMVELSVMGDLKLVDRPPIFTLGPRDSRTLKANIKVSSTETGHIFGTIAYNAPSSPNDQVVINLVEIHVDIMDYIHPATCSDASFRSMWADFEWENKVSVNTNITCVAVHPLAAAASACAKTALIIPLPASPHAPLSFQQSARVRAPHCTHDEHAHSDPDRRAPRDCVLPRC